MRICYILLQASLCTCLNILQIVPGFSSSHEIFNYRIAEVLTKAGHNVTLLNMIMMPMTKSKSPPPAHLNVIHLIPEYSNGTSELLQSSLQEYAFNKKMSIAQLEKFGRSFGEVIVKQCQDLMDRDELLDNLKRSRFDVVLSHFFAFCPNGLAKKLGIEKFIWLGPGTYILHTAAHSMALPTIASYIPYSISDASDRMGFVGRTKNLLWSFNEVAMAYFNVSSYNRERDVLRRYPDADFPDVVQQLAKQAHGLMINGEEFLDFPRPMLPGVMHMGDPERKEAKKLPDDWQSYMDASDAGVILFSLGTVANSSQMPIEMKDAFLSGFSQFKNYSILWRLEGEMPLGLDEHPHIKIVKWIPQKELLHHPKLKLFITHGGYNSLLETVVAGKPMILMPLLSDQYGNARRAVRHGLGLMLDKFNLNPATIIETMETILSDEKFRLNAEKFSSLLTDKIIPDEVNTVKFVERLVRAKNWPTMRAARRFGTFRYYSLDVLTFLVSVLLLTVYLVVKVLIFIFQIVEKIK